MPGSSASKLEVPALVVLERLDQLLAGAHHERSVLGDRLPQWAARNEDGTVERSVARRIPPFELNGVSLGQYRQLVSAHGGRRLPGSDPHRALKDIEECRVAASQRLRDLRTRP